MKAQFEHEKLCVYQDALQFVTWVTPLLEALPAELAARDRLDCSSTSNVLHLAEGYGKRSHADRCRHFDLARAAMFECAVSLGVLVAKKRLPAVEAARGKDQPVALVAMLAGLVSRFSGNFCDEQADYEATSGTAHLVGQDND